MTSFWKSFFVFILVLGACVPTSIAFAGTCVCTTNANDCQAVFLSVSNQTTDACTQECKKILVGKFASSKFEEGTGGDILNQQCTQTHKTFEENAASSKSSGATKPKPVSLLNPALNVEIPGLKFSNAISGPCSFDKNETCIKTNFLGEYLNALYTYLITTATLIAIVMVMVGGLQYTLGASTKNGVEKGKERIKNGVTGLILLLAVFLVLQTTNPQLVFMKIIELQNVEEIEFEDAPVDAGSPAPISFDPSAKMGAPSTKGDGAVITRLLGPPPSSLAPCSKEMFNHIADALSKKNVCVGPMHCAYTASNFLEYAKCTNIYNGNASWLAASLDESGWTAETIRTAKQFSTLPIGLLVMPGHVGISLENGYQFDSGGSTLQFLKNQNGSQTCISNSLQSRKDGGCDYCSVIPEEAPRTGKYAKDSSSENQGWSKIKAAGTWRGDPSRGTWQIILVPPSQASRITPSPKAPCTIKAGGITRTVTISKNLCTMIQLSRAEWKALNPKP